MRIPFASSEDSGDDSGEIKSIDVVYLQNACKEKVEHVTDSTQVFVNVKHVVSLYHVLCSAYKTKRQYEQQRMKSKNIQSELLLNLALSKNVTDAIKHFGWSQNTDDMLLVTFHTTTINQNNNNSVITVEHCEKIVSDHSEIDNLIEEKSNVDQLIKLYKLTPQEKQLGVDQLERHVLSRLAIKDFN